MTETDDLLKKMKQAREAQANIEHGEAKTKSESRVTRMSEDVTLFHRFISQVTQAAQWSFWNVVVPTWRQFLKPVNWLLRQYRKLWALVVYQRDEFDNLRFSKTRAGIMFTATIVFLWFFMFPMLGFVFDTTNYVLTAKHNEVVYLTQSQEIVANDLNENVHSVKGATRLPLNEEDSFYLRIDDSWFNEAWSLIYRNNLFYPDYVAAAVPPVISRCRVTSYGIRLRFIMRNLEVYPHLLSVSCDPLTGTEIINSEKNK